MEAPLLPADHMEEGNGGKAEIAALRDLLARSSRIAVLTGAGISTESGIPDFRSPGGIWTRMKPITFDEFVASEAARLEDWRRRFVMNKNFAEAQPNDAHYGLAQLWREGRLSAVITQNIDGLHQRAGLPPEALIEIHGNSTYGSCLHCRAPMALEKVREIIDTTGASPRCACGGQVKAAIISFGQRMPEEATRMAFEHAASADLFLVVGSSLQVRPAASLPELAKRAGARLAIVNGEATALDPIADLVLRARIGSVFRALRPQSVN